MRGKSLAVRLPSAVVKALDLKEGDEIAMKVTGTETVEVERKLRRKKRLRRFRGMMPADFKFDREETNSR